MSGFQIKSVDHAGRTHVWNEDYFDHHPRLGDLAVALVPASLILAAAAALLVALL
ncbi:MAG: hypothetical protein KIT02_08020 [Devosia sp.]|uniref:hypothetical protein n=1 Tax=Devosia sp. TaxID=1871048 RepID=UPI0024C5F796|nr:hypothetical protein [Devosia sp.]UYO01133.1 MAG: hypothetical protein KIT02_08020 [Devosia sp.]